MRLVSSRQQPSLKGWQLKSHGTSSFQATCCGRKKPLKRFRQNWQCPSAITMNGSGKSFVGKSKAPRKLSVLKNGDRTGEILILEWKSRKTSLKEARSLFGKLLGIMKASGF